MKDARVLRGQFMSGDECSVEAKPTTYFEALQSVLSSDLDGAALEAEWKYPLAWADFSEVT